MRRTLRPPQDAHGCGSIAVAKAVGISLRQLYYWVDVLQVVRPQVRRHGRRRFRRFSAREVRRLDSLRRLVDRGYTLRAAAKRLAHAGGR